jgi:DNA-binding response OmpR family regulator
MTVQEPLKGRRLLLVEDEYFVAAEIAELLRGDGAEVVGPFARVQPALEAIKREKIDGAVLDVRLDGETSEGLAVLLLARRVPVLLVTGYEPDQLPPGLRGLSCLRKPFSPDDLLRALGRLYGRQSDDHPLAAVEGREPARKHSPDEHFG